jgi:DNA-directed RNA polymerase subunit RPC12/RpoP
MICRNCRRNTSDHTSEHPNGNVVIRCDECGHQVAFINGKNVHADEKGRILSIEKVVVE